MFQQNAIGCVEWVYPNTYANAIVVWMGFAWVLRNATHATPVISKMGLNLDAFYRHRSAHQKHRQMNS